MEQKHDINPDGAAEAAEKNLSAAENEEVDGGEQKGDVTGPLDIDSAEKIVFRGKEYTPEELDKMMLRQSDYTKKTQALANERKFYDNLEYDLEEVRANPDLADQFKALYPEKFHAFLNIVLNTDTESEGGKSKTKSDGTVESLRQELLEVKNKLSKYDNKFHEERVEAEQAKLDAVFEELGSKFDLADEDAIVNRAQRLIEENANNPHFQMTKGIWEKLFRADHEMRDKRYGERHKKMLEAQIKKGNEAADGGPGGAAPGREKRRLSFDEATEMAIQDLSR